MLRDNHDSARGQIAETKAGARAEQCAYRCFSTGSGKRRGGIGHGGDSYSAADPNATLCQQMRIIHRDIVIVEKTRKWASINGMKTAPIGAFRVRVGRDTGRWIKSDASWLKELRRDGCDGWDQIDITKLRRADEHDLSTVTTNCAALTL